MMPLARAAALVVTLAATPAYAADIGYRAPPGVAANEFPSPQRAVAQIVSPSRSAEERRGARQEQSKPLLDTFKPWLEAQLGAVSQKSAIAAALRYTLARWEGLCRFLGDGRIEIDSNTVERAIRPLALNRKNALFAGSDGGGEHWAILASLIETCKLNAVDPHAYLSDVFTRLANNHPITRLNELLPWAYASAPTAHVA